MRRLLLAALTVAATAACSTSTLAPLPLSIELEASRTTAAPGDSINFLVTTRGGSLVGVEIDFGDGHSDLYGTSGARTASITFRYAYTARGAFTVRAVVTDALAGQKDATLAVQIN